MFRMASLVKSLQVAQDFVDEVVGFADQRVDPFLEFFDFAQNAENFQLHPFEIFFSFRVLRVEVDFHQIRNDHLRQFLNLIPQNCPLKLIQCFFLEQAQVHIRKQDTDENRRPQVPPNQQQNHDAPRDGCLRDSVAVADGGHRHDHVPNHVGPLVEQLQVENRVGPLDDWLDPPMMMAEK